MKISTNIRNWGEGSERDTLAAAAQVAEDAGIDTLWVNERLSTPPDSGWTPGDGGRYLEPMLTLAWLAARTQRVQLGTGVINLPYRLPFQLLKQVATLQDLSGGRLRLGVGVGWYEAEFQALGVPYRERGKRSDAALALLHEAFSADTVNLNGVALPVLPRPPRPPVYVGGHSEAALRRVIRHGDGWIAAGKTPPEVAAGVAQLEAMAAEAGRQRPWIIAMKTLPLESPGAAVDLVAEYAAAGVDEVVHAGAYADLAAWQARIDALAGEIMPAAAAIATG